MCWWGIITSPYSKGNRDRPAIWEGNFEPQRHRCGVIAVAPLMWVEKSFGIGIHGITSLRLGNDKVSWGLFCIRGQGVHQRRPQTEWSIYYGPYRSEGILFSPSYIFPSCCIGQGIYNDIGWWLPCLIWALKNPLSSASPAGGGCGGRCPWIMSPPSLVGGALIGKQSPPLYSTSILILRSLARWARQEILAPQLLLVGHNSGLGGW